MKIEAENLLNYHLPRFNELPEIELYIDQVICVLQKNLSIFAKNEDTPAITSSMINNYVKQDVMKAPVKKKYDRSHIAHLLVIYILKRSMSISEIKESIEIMEKKYSIEEAYNMFCEELEKALKYTFDPENNEIEDFTSTDSREIATLRAMVLTFSYSVLVDRLILLR